MDLEQRDNHLKQYFSQEVFDQLDEIQKTVLYEEFANSELRIMATQPVDLIKESANRKTQTENERRLSHIQPEEYPLLKDWYKEISNSVHEIICSKCGIILGLEVDTKDDNFNKHHHEGKFVVAIGNNMYSYRPRLDGVMGYQCANFVDSEAKKDWEIFDKDAKQYVVDQGKNQAVFDEAFKKWDKLSDKKKLTTPMPVLKKLPEPTPPEVPPLVPCGNDTRWGQIEIDNISEEHIMTSTTKEDIVKVKQEMNITNYEPDVKKTKTGYKVESFELKEVK